MSDTPYTGLVRLSRAAIDALLSARRSVPGAIVFDFTEPAVTRELLDNGLIRHHRLTRRGANQHALLTTNATESGNG